MTHHSFPTSYPVAPNAVYVWRGFRSPKLTPAQFAQFLGNVFVPACALLQPRVGLRAYLPTLVPETKPASLPDQTALMFWATSQAHDQANQSIAVRIYQNLHGDTYDMARSKLPEVPQSIATVTGSMVAEQPYYLIEKPADWMLGSVHHLVGARRPDLSPEAFLAAVYEWAANFSQHPPSRIDAALVCGGQDYAVAWVHSPDSHTMLSVAIEGLADLTVPVIRQDAQHCELDAGLWSAWPGLDLTQSACLNIQLERQASASPITQNQR